MGLTLPAELTEPLGWVGLTWPEADEELLFEAGQRWIAYGEQLSGIAAQADQQAASVWTSGSGPAVEAFRAWWTEEKGPSRRLAEDAAAALLIGAALVAFAAITLALKVAFIVQLIILAVEVAQAIATAFVTFGATTAEVPGFIAVTRLICRRLVQQVIDHVSTVIKDIFERAARLLKKAERLGARREARALGRSVDIPAPMTEKRFRGKPMLDKYRYETILNDPRNPFHVIGRAVRRLSPEEREAHRLFIDERGLVRRAKDGSLFDTTTATTEHSREGGRAIFVMDEQGNLFASAEQRLGSFHHSTLAGGRPVAAAGELAAVEGRLTHATAASGHYQPGLHEMQQFVDELGRHGIRDVPVLDFAGRTRIL